MPRALRIDDPDARHLVMNRGARREPIFRADNDCLAFLDLPARASASFGLRVPSYAHSTDTIAAHLLGDRAAVSRSLRRAWERQDPDFERWQEALTGLGGRRG